MAVLRETRQLPLKLFILCLRSREALMLSTCENDDAKQEQRYPNPVHFTPKSHATNISHNQTVAILSTTIPRRGPNLNFSRPGVSDSCSKLLKFETAQGRLLPCCLKVL